MLKAIETFDDELRRKVVKVLQDSPSISEAEAIKQARSACQQLTYLLLF